MSSHRVALVRDADVGSAVRRLGEACRVGRISAKDLSASDAHPRRPNGSGTVLRRPRQTEVRFVQSRRPEAQRIAAVSREDLDAAILPPKLFSPGIILRVH